MPVAKSPSFMKKNLLPFTQGIQALSGAYGKYSRGKAESTLSKANAYIASLGAKGARKRGKQKEAVSRQRTGKLIGKQRAAIGAQGVRMDVGSALDVQLEAADIGELDAMTIKNEALREAYGYEAEARGARARGKAARSAGKFGAIDTLLTGGMKVAKSYI